MALVKIVEDFNAIEGWQVGEIVDITNPEVLLREGKVIPADQVESEPIEEPSLEEAPIEPDSQEESPTEDTLNTNGNKKKGK